jgi:hypothetical protein
MAMLAHTRGSFEPTSRSSVAPGTVRSAAACLAMIKRWGMHVLTLLLAASVFTAIIALQAAIYLWCFRLY